MNKKDKDYLYGRLCDYFQGMQFKTKEGGDDIVDIYYDSGFSDCIEIVDQFITEKINENK